MPPFVLCAQAQAGLRPQGAAEVMWHIRFLYGPAPAGSA
jgi:hypothetical protein